MEAFAILPDHIHCIWRMPAEDSDYSIRWRLIKSYFSEGLNHPVNKRGEKEVWQRRFWEHLLRDDEDWKRHMDYIHYNPVKHGYVKSPGDWLHSSFRQAIEDGLYAPDWGGWRNPTAFREWIWNKGGGSASLDPPYSCSFHP